MITISKGADTNYHPDNHLSLTWVTLFLMLVNISNMYGVTNISKLSPTKIEFKKDLKSRIINVYENNDASKCLKSRVLSVLEEEKFNTPNIHAAMLKNFLQNLPEPLLIPGYKKIFNIITGKTKQGSTVHQISQNF